MAVKILPQQENKNSAKFAFIFTSVSEIELIIKRVVIFSDLQTEIHDCLDMKKVADVLVIAHSGGPVGPNDTHKIHHANDVYCHPAHMAGTFPVICPLFVRAQCAIWKIKIHIAIRIFILVVIRPWATHTIAGSP